MPRTRMRRGEALEPRRLLDGQVGIVGQSQVSADSLLRPVAAYDVDGDSHLDLVGQLSSSQGRVLHGDGRGGFERPFDFPLSASITADRAVVAPVQVNGDALPDLMALSSSGGVSTIHVLPGQPGGFGATVVSELPGSATALAAGDLNEDGHLDAVAMGSAALVFAFGDGSGAFADFVEVPLDAPPSDLGIGDFNADSHLDVVVLHAGRVRLLFGDGQGGLSSSADVIVPAGLTDAEVGDLDLDLADDLVLAGAQRTVVLFNDGAGGFDALLEFAGANSSLMQVQPVQDIDGDDWPDAGILRSDVNRLDLIVHGSGPRDLRVRSFSAGQQGRWGRWGDFNEDGLPDAAVGANGGNYVLLGQDDGGFGNELIPVAGTLNHSLAADLNEDGAPDVVTATSSTLSVLLGDGQGDWAPHVELPVASGKLVAADFDGDDHLDVLHGNAALQLYQGDGQGGLTPTNTTLSTAGSLRTLLAADLDRDGAIDVAATGAGLEVYYGDGAGQFPRHTNFAMPAEHAVLADLDGDTWLDLLAVQGNDLLVFLNDQLGAFLPPTVYDSGFDSSVLDVADFDHDGQPDVIVGGLDGGHLRRGAGGGSLGAPVKVMNSDISANLYARDLDHDGNVDLLQVGWYGNYVQWGYGDGAFSDPNDVNVSLAGAPYDLDRDGDLDLLATQGPLAMVSMEYAAPRVESIELANSTSGAAHTVATGSGEQLRTIPLGGIDQVSLTFSGAIDARAADLVMTGSASGVLDTQDFTWDPIARTATWTLTDPLARPETITLALADVARSPAGLRLDGEWDNPTDWLDPEASSVSGDGAPGGDFEFLLSVLPGDANRDGAVTGADFTLWADHFGSGSTWSEGDFNGDQQITGADYTIWADHAAWPEARYPQLETLPSSAEAGQDLEPGVATALAPPPGRRDSRALRAADEPADLSDESALAGDLGARRPMRSRLAREFGDQLGQQATIQD